MAQHKMLHTHNISSPLIRTHVVSTVELVGLANQRILCILVQSGQPRPLNYCPQNLGM